MQSAVLLDQVSKKYRYGSGQISLREALSNSLSRVWKSRKRDTTEDPTFWALRDVSFSVPHGHALGLIGPNGAGKTTALKILANIVEPTAGQVRVQGRISALIELGAGFHPELNGRENIYLNGAILGISRRDIHRQFDQIVDFSGLEKFVDTPVKRYSSGMYVRLGFSVAAFVNPDVLLVDEVLAVGDAQFRQKCAQRIEELQKAGTTIIFVAHNLYLVKSICDLAIFLNEGQIQAQGDVVTTINAYETWLRQRQADFSLNRDFISNTAFGPAHVNITSVDVKKSGGSDTEGLSYQDSVEIVIGFTVEELLRKPKLVIRVMRADGTTCFMIRTADYGLELDELKGSGSITICIDPLQLSGGAYAVDVRLMGPIDGVPLSQGHSKWFFVDGLSFAHEEESGVYVPHVTQSIVVQHEHN